MTEEIVAMRNSKGFTLVELMIAMVIILVSLLGMYKTVLVGIEGNVKNAMRDEGKHVTERVINDIRGLAFDEIVAMGAVYTWTDDDLIALLGMDSYDDPNDGVASPVPRIAVESRNAKRYYKVAVIVEDQGSLKKVRVVVGWNVKLQVDKLPTAEHPTGKEFEHSISTLVRKT